MKNKLLQDFSNMGLSKVLMIASGLVTSMVTARVLGPEKNGLIAALLVYPNLFLSFGSLGVRQSTAYYIGGAHIEEDRLKQAIVKIWLFSTLFCLITSGILMLTLGATDIKLLYILLTLAQIPFSLYNTYSSGVYLGKSEIKEFSRINWIPPFAVMVLTVLLVYAFKLDITGYLFALIGGPLTMFLFHVYKNNFFKYLTFENDFLIIKKILTLGVIYAISLLVINLNYSVDIIFLDKLSTPFETGIYSRGVSITQYLWQIPMLFSTIVFSRSAVAKDKKAFSLQIAVLLRLSLVLIFLGSIVLILFSRFIIITLYGEQFEPSVSVLKLLIPGVLILTLFKVMNMDLAGNGKPWISLKAMLPALLINTLLNLLWVPKYGANGAALASTISYTLGSVLFIHFYSKEVGISIKEIMTYKKSDLEFILNKLKLR